MTLTASIALMGIGIGMGCDDRNTVQVYQAPKEAPLPDSIGAASSPGPAGMSTPPGQPEVAPAVTADGAGPQWTLPAGWTQLPQQAMRYATFSVDPNDPKLNVILYTFGPESAVLLPNINRWKKQIGAALSTAADLPKVVKPLQSNGLKISSVDLNGPAAPGQTEGLRMLAAIIPQPTQCWFVKFAGPESLIAAHQAEYDSFLKSLHFAQAQESATIPAQANPTPVASVPGGQGTISAFKTYSAPSGWMLDPQPRPMRLATFHIGSGDQTADVIITKLPADQFGSPENNMNRWRGQVGLDPVENAASVPRSNITVDGGAGFVVDLLGVDANPSAVKELIVAQIIKGNDAYFFKLIGPAAVVKQQASAFNTFLQSIQFAASVP